MTKRKRALDVFVRTLKIACPRCGRTITVYVRRKPISYSWHRFCNGGHQTIVSLNKQTGHASIELL